MKIFRRATYKIYPNKGQAIALEGRRIAHQQLYNSALEQRISAWKRQKVSLSFYDQCKDLKYLCADDENYKKIAIMSLRGTLQRVDRAYKSFFRRLKSGAVAVGFPRFKSKNRYKGFDSPTHGNGWKFTFATLSNNPVGSSKTKNKGGRLYIKGVGNMRVRGCARTPGVPKTLTVTLNNGTWYASIAVECAPKRTCGADAEGLDWGVSIFAMLATTEGYTEVANPKFLKQEAVKIRNLQQLLVKKKRGGSNRKRVVKTLRRVYERLTRRRKDFMHKQSAAMVSRCALIATEELNIKKLTRSAKGTIESPGKSVRQKASLNRVILDTSPGTFINMLKYKAEEAGCEYVEIPTIQVKPSQTCSGCGIKVEKALSQRQHVCPCGITLGRDENAARVILNWALLGEPNRRGPAVLRGVQA